MKTFKELKEAVNNTTDSKCPSAKQLREMNVKSVAEAPGIVVYENGFFICTENGYSTVYGVHEIKELDYGPGNRIRDIDELPWEIVLDKVGRDRLEHNAESREEYYRGGYVTDVIGEAKTNREGCSGNSYGLGISYTDFAAEMAEREEYEWKMGLLDDAKNVLTDKEREVVDLYYDVVPRTEADVAKILGKSQQAVHKTRIRALEKMRGFYEMRGC